MYETKTMKYKKKNTDKYFLKVYKNKKEMKEGYLYCYVQGFFLKKGRGCKRIL